MWKEIFAAVKEVFVLSEKTEQNKENLKTLRGEFEKLEIKVDQLTDIVQFLAQDNLRMREEIQNTRKEESRERENLALKLENEMLKFERRLPSSKAEED